MSAPSCESLSKVFLSDLEWEICTEALRHKTTTIEVDREDSKLRSGLTRWEARNRKGLPAVQLVWEWREVTPGVIAMTDPMAIASNVVFTDGPTAEGFLLRIRQLNIAVFCLPWQQTVNELFIRRRRVELSCA